MKKKVLIVLIFTFVSFILFVSFANSIEQSKIDKAFTCLEKQINSTSSLTLEQAVFSALAGIKSNKINNTFNSQASSLGCWPNTGCDVKKTAQVILAKDKLKQNTTKSLSWLASRSGTSNDLAWFLQVTIDQNLPANCEVRYNDAEAGFSFRIDEEMKIKEQTAGNCLTRISNGYWFSISANCLDTKFYIKCDQNFITNLLYQKNTGGTIYVSATTNRGDANGWTNEKISALCFKQGNVCNYEATLWATTALYATNADLDKDGVLDYNKYLPYLKALYSDNDNLFSSAFLMYLAGRGRNDEYFSDIVKKWQTDPKGGFWPIFGSPTISYYNTALGIMALGGANSQYSQATQTVNYLFWKQSQTDSGCWNSNSIVDTAFILYALGFSRQDPSFPETSVAICGNNVVDPGEQCDGEVPPSVNCTSLNQSYVSGNISCYAPGTQYECRYNINQCVGGSGWPLPPTIGQQNCSDIKGTCKNNCGISEIELEGYCSENLKCCGQSNGTIISPTGTDCEQAGHYCVSDAITCLEADGMILDLFDCRNYIEKCCTKNATSLPTCASKGGTICKENELCSDVDSIVQSSDGSCCLRPAECKIQSISQEECQVDSDCSSGKVCNTSGVCVDKPCGSDNPCPAGKECKNGVCVTKTSSSSKAWIWILILLILIALVVLAIIFKDKLRLWLFKLRSGKNKPSQTPPPWPPSTGMPLPIRRMPPRFAPPANTRPVLQQRRVVTQQPPAQPAQKIQQNAKDKEMEETLKKLKEISG